MPHDSTPQGRMSEEEFARHGGLRCPFCRGESLSSGVVDADGPTASADDSCDDCGRSFRTLYRVVGYSTEEGDDG